MTDPVRVSVIYYSATGNVHRLAEAVAEGAAKVGADVRLRKVAELAPDDVIETNPQWREHRERTRDIREAAHEDLEWADGVILGTPTRYGTPASQLKQFIDTAAALKAGRVG